MAYKFAIRGIIKDRQSKTVRELRFDNGRIGGDMVLVSEIRSFARRVEEAGDFYNGYSPDVDDYTTDAMAVIFMMYELCDSVQMKGNFPKWDATAEDGVLY